MRLPLLLSCLVGVLALSACDTDPAEPSIPTLDGSWSGTASGISLSMVVNESSASVSGAGSLFASNGSIPVSVSGTHAHPAVALTLRSAGYDDSRFEGNLSRDDRIVGVINGSGFEDFELILRRERVE